MTKVMPERKNDFAVAPHAMNVMPSSSSNETKSVSPHAADIVPPERQAQEDGNSR